MFVPASAQVSDICNIRLPRAFSMRLAVSLPYPPSRKYSGTVLALPQLMAHGWKMNRRHFIFSASGLLVAPFLASCAHRAFDVVVGQRPDQPLTSFDVFMATNPDLWRGSYEYFSRIGSPEFNAIFVDVASQIMAHNGIAGRAFLELSGRQAGRPLVVLRPASIFDTPTARGIIFDGNLVSPVGAKMLSWKNQMLLADIVDLAKGKSGDYEAQAAMLILASLNTMQNEGFIRLKFSPAQTMSGSINVRAGSLK
jgi:hypothetical protein